MKKICLALLALSAWGVLGRTAQAQVIVIVSPNVHADSVSRDDARDIFSGVSSSLKDGSHVTPVLLKAGVTQNDFLAAFIGKSDAGFRASWRSLIFSGQGIMPKQMDSDAAVVEYVAHNPGTIGYIQAATPHDGVKVLAVR